jgi:serine/threonine protein kinase
MGIAIDQQQIFWLGDTLWSVHGDVRDRIFDGRHFRLDEWRRDGRATLIKSGAGRVIYRVRLPGLDLFVKHFRSNTLTGILHQNLRQGRAEKEFYYAHLLREYGIPTIKPVALGERRRHGLLLESYLVTEAVPGGITLYELIERFLLAEGATVPPKLRFHFAEELARLAAAIHEAGLEHRDLHEKNIVVQPNGDGKFAFYLLDLHELEVHRPLPWRRASKELSRMGRYFSLRSSRSDRLRFFQTYAALRELPMSTVKRLVREVEKSGLESRADFWRRRDERPMQKSLRVRSYQAPSAAAEAVQEIPIETVRQLMDDPDAPFQDRVAHWWKVGRATQVAEIELPTVRRGGTLIYKRFSFKGWHQALAALFRQNQATRAWNAGGALLMRELPTPRPLVLIHRYRCGLPVTSYLLTECVPNALAITRYLDRHLPGLGEAERRRVLRGVLNEAARLLRVMHERGVTHRDLKATNILAAPSADLARPRLWLIDLDGVQTWRRIPSQHRMQNLARFYVSFHRCPWITVTDRLRFLTTYLGRASQNHAKWKAVWRHVKELTESKIRKNLRKGRSVG